MSYLRINHVTELTFFAVEGGAIHGLAEDLDGKGLGLFQGHVFFVVLLEDALCGGVVGANAGCLPAAIIA